MFLQVCVCPQGGGCLPQCMLGYHTPLGPGRPTQTRQTPPRDQADPPPRTRQTPRIRQTPPWDQTDPPRTRQTPPRDQADTPPEADCSIRSTSSRYASYWNAFLLKCIFHSHTVRKITILGAGPGFPVGGGANPPTYDFTKFPKNCMKLRNFWSLNLY